MQVVVDSFAWIEYLEGSQRGTSAAQIIDDESMGVLTSAATLAEVVSKFLRNGKDFQIALQTIQAISTIAEVTTEIGVLAGKIHVEQKKKNRDFGMLDAFVAATAEKNNARILHEQFAKMVFLPCEKI